MAATLSMRVAANAVVLVSQPRTAMASYTPQSDAAHTKAGEETATGAAAAAPSSADSARTASPPADAPNQQLSPQAMAAAAKGVSATIMPTDRAAGDQAANASQAPVNSASAANSSAAAAQMAPLQNTTAAPAPAAAAAANLPAPPPTVSMQVALSLHQAVKSGSDHIQIQLQPADLGAVNVKLNINHDGSVTMVVSADRSDTLNLLKQDASGLTQALRNAGLQADSSSLSFNLRGGYQFNQQQQQQPSYSGGGGTPSRYSARANDLAIIAPISRAASSHSGSLDIHV